MRDSDRKIRKTNRHPTNPKGQPPQKKGPPPAFILSLIPVTIVLIVLIATRRQKSYREFMADQSKEDPKLLAAADEDRKTAARLMAESASSIFSDEELREIIGDATQELGQEEVAKLKSAAGKLKKLAMAHDLLIQCYYKYDEMLRKYEYKDIEDDQKKVKTEVRKCQGMMDEAYKQAGHDAMMWKMEAEKLVKAAPEIENLEERRAQLDQAQALLQQATTCLEVLLEAIRDERRDPYEKLRDSISRTLQGLAESKRDARLLYRFEREE